MNRAGHHALNSRLVSFLPNDPAIDLAEPETRNSPTRPRRKQFLRWIVGMLLVLLLGVAGLFVTKDTILRSLVERWLRERIGMAATIGELKLDLAAASLSMKNLRITNPPEYGGARLLQVPELFMKIDWSRCGGEGLHFNWLRLNLAELNIVRGKTGKMNLEAIDEAMRASARNKGRGNAGIDLSQIDRMYLTLGRVRYTDLQEPSKSREFDARIKDELVENLKSPAQNDEWLGGLLFRIILREAFKGSGRRFEFTIDGVTQK